MKLELLKNGVDQISTFLKITDKYMEQFAITVNPTGINLKFIDPSHVCIVSLELKNNKHYKLESLHEALLDKTFELSVKDVSKILSRVEDNTTIVNAETDNSGDLIGINFIIQSNETNEIIKEIQIPAFEYEQSANLPQLSYGNEVPKARMEIDNIVDSIHEINDYETETLAITNTGSEINLVATSSQNTRKKIKINKFQHVDFEDVSEKPDNVKETKAVYSMEYMNYLIVKSNAYKEIDIVYSEKLPISLLYGNRETNENGNLVCILAPKVEE